MTRLGTISDYLSEYETKYMELGVFFVPAVALVLPSLGASSSSVPSIAASIIPFIAAFLGDFPALYSFMSSAAEKIPTTLMKLIFIYAIFSSGPSRPSISTSKTKNSR